MPLGTGLGSCHIVLDWDPAPLPRKGGTAPNFWPMSVVTKWLDGSRCHLILDREEGLSPGDIVLDGNLAPPKKGEGTASPLMAHVYCGQTAGWIKMPLGTEVVLPQATLC